MAIRETTIKREPLGAGVADEKHPRHDVLGSRLPGGNKNVPTWRNILRYKDVDWLGHHRVSSLLLCVLPLIDSGQLGSEIIFPAAGYICMAVEAITQTWELDGHKEQVSRVVRASERDLDHSACST